MGSSRWDDTSNAVYNARVTSRSLNSSVVRSGTAYTAAIDEGKAERKVHQMLNPHGLTVRESRDSAANPNSLAIAVFFDVTGSMGSIPVTLQKKLKTLMGLLVDRAYVADPHILFGAVGDATCDTGPLQVGQFEADVQMDEDMSRMWLEGGGGGQNTESYELAYLVAARHTAIDCWEKRQQKGYLFTIGDEQPYLEVRHRDTEKLFGRTNRLEQNIATADLLAEADQKYHVFHILADTATSRRYPETARVWRELLGDRVLPMSDPGHVAELIALVIGLSEGRADIDNGAAALREMGVPPASVEAILQAVAPFVRAIRVRA